MQLSALDNPAAGVDHNDKPYTLRFMLYHVPMLEVANRILQDPVVAVEPGSKVGWGPPLPLPSLFLYSPPLAVRLCAHVAECVRFCVFFFFRVHVNVVSCLRMCVRVCMGCVNSERVPTSPPCVGVGVPALMQPLVVFAKTLARDFFLAAKTNPLLFVEALFHHSR